MALLSLAFIIFLFWGFVYLRQQQVSRNSTILPLTRSNGSRTEGNRTIYHSSWITVEHTSALILRAKITTLVEAHTGLVGLLSRQYHSGRPRKFNWNKLACLFYDAGSLFAIAGQIVLLMLLPWILLRMGERYFLTGDVVSESTYAVVARTLSKRGSTFVPTASSTGYSLQPLIPGLTVPLSHAFPVFISLLICTFIHEVGHGISAAAENIPLISWGYALILAIPAAFVELSTPERELSPRTRIRIASAGSYHNLLTLGIVYLCSASGLHKTMWSILGYFDINRGVVIYGVKNDSPLQDFLQPGQIITQLDDVPLIATQNETANDIWFQFLLGGYPPELEAPTQGWCSEKTWFDTLENSCCIPSKNPLSASLGSCFTPYPSSSNTQFGHCLDPVPLFENSTQLRCTSDASCGRGYMCISPALSAELLRIITVDLGDGGVEKVVVWRGPRKEVWEQVVVGSYYRNGGILPSMLPYKFSVLIHYIKTVSLSLFFFNLLPFRALDGGEILSAFLAMVFSLGLSRNGEYIELEDGTRRDYHPERVGVSRIRETQVFVERATLGMIGLVVLSAMVTSGLG